MAEGFVEGDFFRSMAALDFPSEDFANLGNDMGVVDQAGGFGVEELGSGGEDAGSAAGDHGARGPHRT